ncbi:hypothetical protein BCR36DRAFT_311631 [Piromyces finnis]|uniref:Stealth protein CR2 conserved region 2 domain-containing protein n=1 Tax=Piromyces finnis TaxID=1754191 RepID=A0A1Y1UTP7_9FUNG|nr:hypothetical protein BCR36DRAFT_311631 [Piromyces finnis]|eukprot:ORX41393.1 hypothetical protein BCR36DRAFT_311631 [Piromyces finnis]
MEKDSLYKGKKTFITNNKENQIDNKKNSKESSRDSSLNEKIHDPDWDIIRSYKGGELEPEWEWAKTISIVYTWVNGNDIDFLDEKSKYNGGYRSFNSRDRSADELRYSIRSLEKYMPWHKGTIYIVTNNQIPKWLDTSNPRIKIIYHQHFIPEFYLPTYDSNVIELFLDKIPNITEYYLYFNDDIFLNNYIHPSFFFTSKTFYPKVYRSRVLTLKKDVVDKVIEENDTRKMFLASKYFTREILREYFDPNFEYRYLLHTVYVIYRDLMEPFRQLFKDEIQLICSDKFRSPFEPHTLYLYQTYLYYATQHEKFPVKLGGQGKASTFIGHPLPKKIDSTVKKYSCEMVPEEISKQYIKFGSITNNYNINLLKFNRFRNDKNILVYNFNDEYSTDISLYQFTEYMISRYPIPSSFEKKDYIDLELAIQPLFEQINKLSDTIENKLPNNYNKKENKKMNEFLKKYQLIMVKNYINNKDSLSPIPSQVSEKEYEEIDFHYYYDPNLRLEEEWEWAKHISFVYYLEKRSKDKNKENRITEEDKLKYSLRSIQKYLPWFKGTIYIITQKQATERNNYFSWLNQNARQIKVVYQNDILPEAFQNTKNRHVVEMYLDRLPGLSEKFIYMKSNQYFINYTHPRYFFNINQYPKFIFKPPVSEERVGLLSEKDQPFYQTHELIKKYFGNSFFRSYRYLYNAPISLYRDIFPPVRELFEEEFYHRMIESRIPSTKDLLPMYLITNYIIYGASQPFYPSYVAGYGEIRKVKPPFLNPDRSVVFYGYDIPSRTVNRNIAVLEHPFSTEMEWNEMKLEELSKSIDYEVMISFVFIKPSKYTSKIKQQFMHFMDNYCKEKSIFEL